MGPNNLCLPVEGCQYSGVEFLVEFIVKVLGGIRGRAVCLSAFTPAFDGLDDYLCHWSWCVVLGEHHVKFVSCLGLGFLAVSTGALEDVVGIFVESATRKTSAVNRVVHLVEVLLCRGPSVCIL